MNKEELVSALDKISPSEELIQKTLLTVNAQKQTEKNTLLSFFRSFSFRPAYKYATAICAFALILCLGIPAILKNNAVPQRLEHENPIDTRLIDPNAQSDLYGISTAFYSPTITDDPQAIEVQGTLQACYLSAVTAEETASGIIAHGTVEIIVTDPNQFAPANNAPLCAHIYFYDTETLNTFAGAISEHVCFTLISEETNENNNWRIIRFSQEADN